MPRIRRALARSLVLLFAAVSLVPIASPPASAVGLLCNTDSWIIGFANSKYTTAELNYAGSNYGMLRSRASSPGPWEKFTICVDYQYGPAVMYIFSDANDLAVAAELNRTGTDYGMLRARSTSVVGPWEKFTIR